MRYVLAAAAALAVQVSAAHADTVVALIGSDVLATIDTNSGKAKNLTKIEGIGPVLGIDVRPSDGQLYALSRDGTIATIDPMSGQATPKSKLDRLPPADLTVSVDFNPVADRMRIIGSDGTDLRANVDDGKVTEDKMLKFADTDPAGGGMPMVVAAGYANSVKGAKETTLYDIDVNLGVLFRQAPPNDGVLNTIGMLGIDAVNVGFDIATDASGANTGVLVAKGNLYSVDLTSGKVISGKRIAGLPADVRDIAVLPAMLVKAASADMKSDGSQMKASADMTAGYLPQPMSGMMAQTKPMSRMKAGDDMKGTRMQRDAYSAPKAKRGPQCNNRTAQY
jgi:hypothetical protein